MASFQGGSAQTNTYNPDVFFPVEQGIAPYLPVHGGHFSGKTVGDSPDPLVSYVWEQETDDLQIYCLKATDVVTDHPGSFENLASVMGDDGNILVNGEGTLCFDFGVESAAWLEFESPDLSGEVLMSISEYNQPAIVNSGPQSPHKTAKPVKYGNTYRLELNAELYEGIRFGWIHVTKFDKPWHITNVRLVCQTKPVNYRGHFESSNTLLNRMWYTGAYGVKLNLLKDHIGAILMDRGDRHSWTGDAYISQGVSMVAFGNYEMVRHNLQRTSADDNSIESYALLWIHSLLDYYYYSGDEDFVRSHLGTIKRKIAHAAEVCDSETNLGFYGWDERIGAGFEDPNIPENRHAYRLLYAHTCAALSRALVDLGEEHLSNAFRRLADGQLKMIRGNTSWLQAIGLHAAAEAINGGYLTDSEASALANVHFRQATNTVSFSPFNQYFIIKAMASMGMHREALETIDRVWGGQLHLGATTFWECFRPEWSNFLNPNDPVPNGQHGYTSLCHPWSSGVTKWLSEEILGIKPIAPGFKRFQVRPHLSEAIGAVQGEMPTPLGTIVFSIDVDRKIALLQAPAGTVAHVAIPKMGRKVHSVSVNGKLIYPADGTADDAFVYLPDLPGGDYRITMEYGEHRTDRSPIAPKADAENTIRLIATDSVTTEWRERYGAAGYLLFDNRGDGVDQRMLPEYIEKIAWKTAGTGTPRLGDWLSTDGQFTTVLATQNPQACHQTFYVDILAKPEKAYQFTLRMAELGIKGKFTVDLFDYNSKNLIHPTICVATFGKSNYYTFKTTGSVRIRISHLEGEDAALSGIFFQ
ncbi:alpha-L-rhamnosidase C-terminal domain-containing protein [Parapedobacter sp. DT-150]|uniref:alpha-L-rhamnosidase C-terminal domain-containing protein n=1 Tax=Parapedobacter sp. DT-150 TaxID=3396162 RepID=UPI003F53EE10